MQVFLSRNGERMSEYRCFHNKAELQAAEVCGCFYCLKVFPTKEIKEWVDMEKDTGLCPYCGIDALIPNETNKQTLKALYKEGFLVAYEGRELKRVYLPGYSDPNWKHPGEAN